MRKQTINERLSASLARARQKMQSAPVLRVLGGRGAATLLLGAALSVGGVTEAFDNTHFLIEKDLDAVRVFQQNGKEEKVVAKIVGGVAGNTVFKLSQLLPDKYVSRELALFDNAWLPAGTSHASAPQKKRSVFFEEMARINETLRRDFFNSSMPYGDLIHEKAEKYHVDPILVAAVIEQESKFRRKARSQVGARGLMQLMPKTGRWMGASDLYDPEQNVDAGVKYIKYLQEQFDGNLRKTIAAYNAGEGNVRRYNGVPPFRETQHYVKKVLHNYDRRHQQLKQFEKDQLQGGAPAAEADGTLALR